MPLDQTDDAIRARLTLAVPGAEIHEEPSNPPEQRFVVMGRNPRSLSRKNSQLGHGASRREAVDRVCFLFERSR